MVLCLLILKIANSAKMQTSAKNCSRQQIFLSCIFTFQAILSIFVFADSVKISVEICRSQQGLYQSLQLFLKLFA